MSSQPTPLHLSRDHNAYPLKWFLIRSTCNFISEWLDWDRKPTMPSIRHVHAGSPALPQQLWLQELRTQRRGICRRPDRSAGLRLCANHLRLPVRPPIEFFACHWQVATGNSFRSCCKESPRACLGSWWTSSNSLLNMDVTRRFCCARGPLCPASDTFPHSHLRPLLTVT